MPNAVTAIDLRKILSIQRAIAGQLDFRAVIRAVSNEISGLLPHDHLDVAVLSGDNAQVAAYETGSVLVSGGIAKGEAVVTEGGKMLRPGQVVDVIKEQAK